MPIAALSENASRAICSSLVLNDSISVIKELLDNALDSHATNIIIEISANTLDIIQIKDNGAGIGVEDRQLLCKRGYTSKIRTFEDLTQLGGTFLGFRGEALASIAELSDNVTFTTRVDGETVGTLLKFNSSGKLISSSSAAHGTGTTVRVSNFLQSIPVRKQTALKQATKTLSNVKKLLFEYAFARPTVKIQFKVLKSGSDLKANWSFAPCPDASDLLLVASKIVGKDIAMQCKQRCVTSDDGSTTINALLIAAGADITKCGGIECFFSIDGRPLTVERGVIKDLIKIYKSYVTSILPEDVPLPKKIFLLLRLNCPRGSYDVNVEPAKNEVMFEDSQLIPDLFESMCKATYGEKATRTPISKTGRTTHADHNTNFDMLSAKKPVISIIERRPDNLPLLQMSDAQSSSADATSSMESTRTSGRMDDMDGRDLLTPDTKSRASLTEDHVVESDEDIMNPHVTNPFVLAKVNTRVRPPEVSIAEKSCPTLTSETRAGLVSGVKSRQNIIENVPTLSNRARLLPSPSPSPERGELHQNPGPPNRPWKSRRLQDDDDDLEETSSSATGQHTNRSAEPTLIDSWTRSVNLPTPQREPQVLSLTKQKGQRGTGVMSATGSPDLSGQATTPNKKVGPLGPVHRPKFRTPFKKHGSMQENSLLTKQSSSESHIRFSNAEDRHHGRSGSPSEAETAEYAGFRRPELQDSDDLNHIMDFEHRKRSAILQNRERVGSSKDKGKLRVADRTDEEPSFTVPARPENEGLPPTPPSVKYAARFGSPEEDETADVPPQPDSSAYTQNPHFNRFRKAVRDLDERAPRSSVRDPGDGIDRHKTTLDGDLQVQSASRTKGVILSTKDPRAYLIRHADNKAPEPETKPKRSLTAKLPFETIGPEVATYTCIGVLEQSGLDDRPRFTQEVKALSQIDMYVYKGLISTDLEGRVLPTSILQQWQRKLEELLDSASAVPGEHDED